MVLKALGMMVILSSPSGAGKTTLAKLLADRNKNLKISISHTTRIPRRDEIDGKDMYAKTKGLGEVINENHLTIRTSVVGPEITNGSEELFNWFMNQSGVIEGFTKAIWSGVTTIELAKAIKWFIVV